MSAKPDDTVIRSDLGRLELREVEVRSSDGSIEWRLVPDPTRNEWIERGKERFLRIRATGQLLAEDAVRDLLDRMNELPRFKAPAVPSADVLLAQRRDVIAGLLARLHDPDTLASAPGSQLSRFVGQDVMLSALSVDLVESTRLQASNPEAYNTIVPILLHEIGEIGAVFGGTVVKNVGDGAILAFIDPGFCIGADMAFDAATAISAVVYEVLNRELRKAGLPAVHIRIGAEAHAGRVELVGAPKSGRQPDLLSLGVSLASKIESRCKPGEIWVGQSFFEIVNHERKAKLSSVPLDDRWAFLDRDGRPYALHRVAMCPPLQDPAQLNTSPLDVR